MISRIKIIAPKARRGRYAIPAFNVSNLEMTQAVIRAAAKMKSPVIVQTSEAAFAYGSQPTLLSIIHNVALTDGAAIPVVSHLDHGKHFDIVKESIALGYTSVHRDASELSFAKNVAQTKKAVQLGHKNNVDVQGELGSLWGAEGLSRIAKGDNYTSSLADPSMAREFVRKTGVDTLAVNVGTLHGSFKGIEKIDFPRLREIAKLVSLPLVLHGGSGNKPRDIKKAIQLGVSIINVDTDLRLVWLKALSRAVTKTDFAKKIDPRDSLSIAREAMQKKAEEIITLFGSRNKA